MEEFGPQERSGEEYRLLCNYQADLQGESLFLVLGRKDVSGRKVMKIFGLEVTFVHILTSFSMRMSSTALLTCEVDLSYENSPHCVCTGITLPWPHVWFRKVLWWWFQHMSCIPKRLYHKW
jgi:hypothetical protein